MKTKNCVSTNFFPPPKARLTAAITRTLLPLLLLFATLPAAAQAQDYTYTTSNNQITITGYTGGSGAVAIPSTINGLPVTRISDGAFARTGLTSVTIPNSVTSIGDFAFYNCSSLGAITVEALNNSYSSVEGVLFNKSQTTLVAYPAGKTGSYTIPNSVTSIGTLAFGYSTSLTSVTIPNSVTTIGEEAFSGCTSLTSVTIPNSVTSIGDFAFYNCSSLTSVTIPNSVTSIGDQVFSGCSSLTSVTIPNSVTTIERWAFGYCTSLTSVTIPNSVTSIGDFAFYNCSSLMSVIFEGDAPSVDPSSFANARNAWVYYLRGTTGWEPTFAGQPTRLWDPQDEYTYTARNGQITITGYTGPGGAVTIPSTINGLPVTAIGSQAFYFQSSLTSVTIPNSVTSIGDVAFYYCTSLTSVTIPNSVTSIGPQVFSYCASLANITIPNSVTTIEHRAFGYCTSLTSVTIPNSVVTIGDYAFEVCTSLGAITVEALNNSYSSVEGVLFNKSQTTLVAYPAGKTGSYTIPNSVTTIGDGAFHYSTSLTSVTIPNSVTSIGTLAFGYSTSLTSVTIPNSVTTIETWAFFLCPSLGAITVEALNNSYSSVEGVLFNKSQTTLVAYPARRTTITLPR